MASVLQELRSCRDDAIAVVDTCIVSWQECMNVLGYDISHDISITLAMTQ